MKIVDFKKIALALMVSAVMVGCTENIVPVAEENPFIETYETETDKAGTYKVSIEESKARLGSFMQAMADDVNTYSSDGDELQKWQRRIGNVEAIRANNSVKTYAEESGLEIDIDTLMYVINFENEEGFALMAADKRTDPIYAIIDDGSFSMDDIDRIDNPGFIICLEDAITKIVNDIQDCSESSDPMVTTYAGDPHIKELMPAKLHTKWGQTFPYNNCSPKVDKIKSGNGKGYTGCTVTSTAQILSYFQTVASVSYNTDKGNDYFSNYGSSLIHWDKIISDCKIREGKRYGTLKNNTQSATEVAYLMRYLGVSMNATYKEKGTSVNHDDARNWMNNWGGLSASSFYDYEWTKTINALKSGKLVWANAYRTKNKKLVFFNEYVNGHSWVIDGYLIYSTPEGTANLLHCNFGYTGQADGYYLDGIFNIGIGGGTTEGWEYMVDWDGDNNRPETDKRVPEERNYKYKKKISIVDKK